MFSFEQIVGSESRAPRCARRGPKDFARKALHRAARRRERHRQGAGRARASTSRGRARTRHSWRSTAPPSPSRCSRPSSSATSAAPSPARSPTAGLFEPPTAARSFSTRSARCRCSCSPSCCACSRTGAVRARRRDARRGQIDCARRRRHQPRARRARCEAGSFARISSTACTSSTSTLPPLRERPEDIAPLAAHFLDAALARDRRAPPRSRARRRRGAAAPPLAGQRARAA